MHDPCNPSFFLTGNQFMTSFGLWPLTRGYSANYMDNFDPRITNEFATAAFRCILLLKFNFAYILYS